MITISDSRGVDESGGGQLSARRIKIQAAPDRIGRIIREKHTNLVSTGGKLKAAVGLDFVINRAANRSRR